MTRSSCPDGTLHMVIGDVCGHGADEAALGASLRIAWRALTLARRDQEEVIQTLHEMLPYERHHPDIFATLSVLTVHPERDRVTVRLAGHPPPILVDGEGVQALQVEATSPPIGLFDRPARPGVEIELEGPWSLLMYTDGMIEGRVGAGSGTARGGASGRDGRTPARRAPGLALERARAAGQPDRGGRATQRRAADR